VDHDLRMNRRKEEVILIFFAHFPRMREAEHVDLTIARLRAKSRRRGSFEELGEAHRDRCTGSLR